MRLAEMVKFGGAGFDRAGHLRSDAARLARDPGARVIVFWRGKPLIIGDALLRLSADHPILADAAPGWMFLGLERGAAVFAADLSGWQPADLDLGTIGAFLDLSEQSHPAAPDAVFAELRTLMVRLTPGDAELAATARAVMAWHDSHGFCARCGAASEIVMGGWQRDCPACGTHHFPRTDPVVIMLVTRGNAVLLGRSPGWPEGMYSLLAGFVEPGETIEAAVRREVAEESGIVVGAVSYLASQPWPFPASLMIGCAGVAETDAITLDPAELEDAIWVSREDVVQAFAGDHPRIKPARKGSIAHFLLQNWLADTLD